MNRLIELLPLGRKAIAPGRVNRLFYDAALAVGRREVERDRQVAHIGRVILHLEHAIIAEHLDTGVIGKLVEAGQGLYAKCPRFGPGAEGDRNDLIG